MSLHTKVHTKYFLRCLGLLPAHATPYDSSRTALAYFCISGLAVLGTLESSTTPEQRTEWGDWLLSNLVDSGEGFRGSVTHKIDTGDYTRDYDCANLPSTYFSIMCLATLRDDRLKQLDRVKICEYIGRCQRDDGSFAPNWMPSVGPFGENDPRCNYMAAGVFKSLGAEPELVRRIVNIPMALAFVLSTINYDGGMGQSLGAESHAGLTFCGLASLDIFLAYEDKRLGEVYNWEKTVAWLARRQINPGDSRWDPEEAGGFNGRTGKPADTCYAFWVSASLNIIHPGSANQLIDTTAAERYILEVVQQNIIGGFAKLEGENPDQLHSYLGIAALSVMRSTTAISNDLAELVPSQVITLPTAAWLAQLWSGTA